MNFQHQGKTNQPPGIGARYVEMKTFLNALYCDETNITARLWHELHDVLSLSHDLCMEHFVKRANDEFELKMKAERSRGGNVRISVHSIVLKAKCQHQGGNSDIEEDCINQPRIKDGNLFLANRDSNCGHIFIPGRNSVLMLFSYGFSVSVLLKMLKERSEDCDGWLRVDMMSTLKAGLMQRNVSVVCCWHNCPFLAYMPLFGMISRVRHNSHVLAWLPFLDKIAVP